MTGLPQCPHCMAELPNESIAANAALRRTIRILQARLAEREVRS